MITSFNHKRLKELFTKGTSAKLPAERQDKINKILAILHAIHDVSDLKSLPQLRLHKLKKPPLRGHWSLDITGNNRITFRFEDGNVSELDYSDTH